MTRDLQTISRSTLAEIVTAPSGADASLTKFIAEHRAQVDAHIQTRGAVLFRGFGIADAARLREVVTGMCGQPRHYAEGSSQRRRAGDAVYTATEYPPEQQVPLHNELSYTRRYPGLLFFCCAQAPASGGQTPLADGRRLLSSLQPDLVTEFERRQVAYVRNLRSQATPGPGPSWQAVWETDNRYEAEAYCAQEQIDIEWNPDGSAWTRQIRPATVAHPKTGEKVWFNQADLFHPSNPGAAGAADLAEVRDPDDLPRNATFGDGAPIPAEMLDAIRTIGWSEATSFDWQKGDLLVVDNMLVAHGRMPFEGQRSLLVAMA